MYSAESGRIKVDEERMRETLNENPSQWSRLPTSAAFTQIS